jgi:hypothetical protein
VSDTFAAVNDAFTKLGWPVISTNDGPKFSAVYDKYKDGNNNLTMAKFNDFFKELVTQFQPATKK